MQKLSIHQHVLVLFVGLMLVWSCDKALDKEPLGRLDAGSFFKTADDAIQVLNACYESLLFNNNNSNFFWAFGTVASDNAIAGGDGSRAGILEIDLFRHTPRTQELNDYWKLNYAGIAQCNTVLEKTPLIEADQELKDRIKGEALFLRSWYYFSLTQVFGDVPLIIRVLPPEEIRQPRSAKSEVHNQIVSDCQEAAGLLPLNPPPGQIFRVTKGAALALLAKTNLYQKEWAQVVDVVAEIKSLGIYELVNDYASNFQADSQQNSENIFQIFHDNLELGVGNNINQWWASKKLEDGYGYAEITEDFALAFEADDPRRSATIASRGDDYLGIRFIPSFSSTGHSPVKFLQAAEAVSQKSDGGINITAIRFAEVLLWEAEALNELGRVAEAQVPLESVRARARAQSSNPENVLPPITTMDQSEMRSFIQRERRLELGLEMHRFFDLVRWEIAADKLDGFQRGKHEVFPIPQTEIDLNPLLTQNPGY